ARKPENRYSQKLAATGFLALSRRYATAPEELWHLTIEDAIETTGAAFLGLTLRCARCHDHKFDPTTREDYYALYGLFAGTKFPHAGSEGFHAKGFPRAHLPPLIPPSAARPRMEQYERRLQQLRAEIARIEADDPLANQVSELTRRIDPIDASVSALESS